MRRAALCMIAALLLAGSVLAQTSEGADEARVKAAFLLRFGQFVVWPRAALPQADTPLVIGVAGADDLAAELSRQSAAGRAVQKSRPRAELATACTRLARAQG